MAYIIAAAAAVLCAGLTAFAALRKNTTVYRKTGSGNDYSRCGRVYVDVKNPEIRVDRVRHSGGELAFEINAKTSQKLRNRTVRVTYCGRTFEHPVEEVNGSYWFKTDVGAPPEKNRNRAGGINPSALTGILRNRMISGGICLLLSAVIAFGILPSLYSGKASTTEVVRLKETVSQGTIITEDMLITAQTGTAGLSDRVIRDKSEVTGLAAGRTVYAGENLWKDSFVSPDSLNNGDGNAAYELNKDRCLVTLSMPSQSAGLAGCIHSGDTVDVYRSVKNSEGGFDAEKVLESITVLSVMNKNLQSVDRERIPAPEDGKSPDYDTAPAYAVFCVSDNEAQTLIALETEGSLHLVLKGERR